MRESSNLVINRVDDTANTAGIVFPRVGADQNRAKRIVNITFFPKNKLL